MLFIILFNNGFKAVNIYKRDLVVITLSLLSFQMIDCLLTLAKNVGHINRFVEYQPLGKMLDASGGSLTSDSRIKCPEL